MCFGREIRLAGSHCRRLSWDEGDPWEEPGEVQCIKQKLLEWKRSHCSWEKMCLAGLGHQASNLVFPLKGTLPWSSRAVEIRHVV